MIVSEVHPMVDVYVIAVVPKTLVGRARYSANNGSGNGAANRIVGKAIDHSRKDTKKIQIVYLKWSQKKK